MTKPNTRISAFATAKNSNSSTPILRIDTGVVLLLYLSFQAVVTTLDTYTPTERGGGSRGYFPGAPKLLLRKGAPQGFLN